LGVESRINLQLTGKISLKFAFKIRPKDLLESQVALFPMLVCWVALLFQLHRTNINNKRCFLNKHWARPCKPGSIPSESPRGSNKISTISNNVWPTAGYLEFLSSKPKCEEIVSSERLAPDTIRRFFSEEYFELPLKLWLQNKIILVEFRSIYIKIQRVGGSFGWCNSTHFEGWGIHFPLG